MAQTSPLTMKPDLTDSLAGTCAIPLASALKEMRLERESQQGFRSRIGRLHPFLDKFIQNRTHLDSFQCAQDFELKL